MKILLFIAILFSAACNTPNDEIYEVADEEVYADFEELLKVPVTEQPPTPTQANVSEQITKKTIKTGGIDFESENIDQDYKAIRQLLPDFNAYIESENQSKTTQQINYYLTIRVASNNYDSLFNSLTHLANRLDNKYSNIEDVTERYYDLKTRIKNKKALEQRYIELLDKALEVTDIIEIEKNLNEVRTEIERLEGQFNYLSKQLNFSTIQLSFYEVLPYSYDSIQRKSFGARLLNALDNGWQGFLTFLIGFTSLWPFIFVIAGGIYLFKKGRSKWKKKKISDNK